MQASSRIIPSHNVREFFRDSVGEALSKQSVQAEDHTVHYVVEMLTLFTRAEEFHDPAQEAGSRSLRPLALMLKDAVDAPSEVDRDRATRPRCGLSGASSTSSPRNSRCSSTCSARSATSAAATRRRTYSGCTSCGFARAAPAPTGD